MLENTINDDKTIAGGIGTMLAGRYHILRQLGEGGMGSVWLAEDRQLDNRKVAIKMLPSIVVTDKRAYQQLKSEALVSLKLVHPNIVTLRAFEENNGAPFLVMDYIEGQTLSDYLAVKGKLSEAETIKLLKPIAAALDYAHGEKVIHRDVKPSNIIIRRDGHPFILDFGIAREIQESMTRVTGRTISGTLLYMSPEQLRGAPPTPAQDVYSFASMCYECLKGEPPFTRGNIVYQIINEQPTPLMSRSQFAKMVMAGLSKDVKKRPKRCAMVLGVDFSVTLINEWSNKILGMFNIRKMLWGAGAIMLVAYVGVLLCGISANAKKSAAEHIESADLKGNDAVRNEAGFARRHRKAVSLRDRDNDAKIALESIKSEKEKMRKEEATQRFLDACREEKYEVAASLINLIDLDNIDVQFNLAVMYENGEGVEKDVFKAVKWYRKAAERGNTYAQFNLGLAYIQGKAVKQDEVEAFKWFYKAADQGYAAAQYNLGVMYRDGRGVTENESEAVKWYRKAAEQGHAVAQYILALYYMKGEVIGPSDIEAVNWFRKAAEQGEAGAQYCLGVMYNDGRGVSKDYKEAVNWYHKSAEQGYIKAQYNLGVMYWYGYGVLKNWTEAKKWFNRAAEQGDERAQKALRELSW